MIDLTPLDVRRKRGDFTKALRGYDTQQVDSFLELVAEHLEDLVKQNLQLTERVERLTEQVEAQSGREQAVNDALVTAQQLREDISTTAEREADVIRSSARADAERLRSEAERDARDLRSEAERDANRMHVDAQAEARKIVSDSERRVEELHHVMRELERRRARFLTNFRQLLERELDTVEVQESRNVDEDMPVDLDLGGRIGGIGLRRAAEKVAIDELPDADELDADADEEEGANVVDDGIRAEPLGVFDPVEDVPPVPEKPPEQAPWGIEDPEEALSRIEEVRREAGLSEPEEAVEADAGHDPAVTPDEEVPAEEPRAESDTPIDPPAGPPGPAARRRSAEIAVDLRPPAPESDVHRLASDTRLSADPPETGLDWLDPDESDDER